MSVSKPSLDLYSRSVRLYRCRNLRRMMTIPRTGTGALDTDDEARQLAQLSPSTKFKLATEHLQHRQCAIENQILAYKTWERISAKPSSECTPGEEHFVLCMREWERAYKPLLSHHDFECDAAIMLFDTNMAWHDQAAQALMTMEENKRLRIEKSLNGYKNGPPLTDTANKRTLEANPTLEVVEVDRKAAAKRSKTKSRPASPTSPRASAKVITLNASL